MKNILIVTILLLSLIGCSDEKEPNGLLDIKFGSLYDKMKKSMAEKGLSSILSIRTKKDLFSTMGNVLAMM